MQYAPDSPFYRLLATKYDPAREQEAMEILVANPEVAGFEWPGPDVLIEAGADMNDRRYITRQTPLAVALESNEGAIQFLRSIQAANS